MYRVPCTAAGHRNWTNKLISSHYYRKLKNIPILPKMFQIKILAVKYFNFLSQSVAIGTDRTHPQDCIELHHHSILYTETNQSEVINYWFKYILPCLLY